MAANSCERECGESRKKPDDSARSNPKHHNNGQSAAKLRIEEGSETKRSASRDDDIVQAPMKIGGYATNVTRKNKYKEVKR